MSGFENVNPNSHQTHLENHKPFILGSNWVGNHQPQLIAIPNRYQIGKLSYNIIGDNILISLIFYNEFFNFTI